jgi:hypothetical protein
MTERPWWHSFWVWLQHNSLWLVAIGVMLASSGIDGAYMEKLNAWTWFGYVLNTVSDIASPAIMYWYGRLQQDRSSSKRDKSRNLLWSEWMFIGFSWLFSWRQLRPMVYQAETSTITASFGAPVWAQTLELEVLALLFAGFAPALLAAIGYAQSLLHGRIDEEPASSGKPIVKAEPEPLECPVCGATCGISGRPFLTENQLKGHMKAHAGDNGRHPQPERMEAREL